MSPQPQPHPNPALAALGWHVLELVGDGVTDNAPFIKEAPPKTEIIMVAGAAVGR